MNLPGKPRTEEEQNREHQSELVRSLLDKNYSVKQILDLTDVDGVDLDRETAKEILAYDEAGKQALRETVSQIYGVGKYVAKSMYIPISSLVERFSKTEEWDSNARWGHVFGTFSSWFGNALVSGSVAGITGDEKMALGYILTTLGINAADGVYSIFRHNRNRIVEERMSELEQITNGKDEEEIFE